MCQSVSLKFCHKTIVFMFFKKIEIIEYDCKMIPSLTQCTVVAKVILYKNNDQSLNSSRNSCFMETRRKMFWSQTHQLSSIGPSELQASLVSYCHFKLFRATHSLREDFSLLAISLFQCQTSSVVAKWIKFSFLSSSRSSHSQQNATNKVEACLSQARLANRK